MRSTLANQKFYSFNLPMKQLRTIENEMMMYVQVVSGLTTKADDLPLPGKQVVNNILNYARCLQVMKTRSGETMLLNGN